VFADERGKLTLLHLEDVPFTAARAYVISDVPIGAVRGGHSSRAQHRFLVGVSGQAEVTLDDGQRVGIETLSGGDALHIPPGVWFELVARVAPVTILVLADGRYDPSDQIAERPAAAGTVNAPA
jgi:mannose-6-phosphate isomerase-like protein (cupin superfamily)